MNQQGSLVHVAIPKTLRSVSLLAVSFACPRDRHWSGLSRICSLSIRKNKWATRLHLVRSAAHLDSGYAYSKGKCCTLYGTTSFQVDAISMILALFSIFKRLQEHFLMRRAVARALALRINPGKPCRVGCARQSIRHIRFYLVIKAVVQLIQME